MLLLGIDLGTSSVKVSVVDSQTQQCVATASYPETELEVIALKPGWAEQSPDMWWENVQQAILKCNATGKYNPADIHAIGIAYQMHGLVLVDKDQNTLRNAIIWCDSRAVAIGDEAAEAIGNATCRKHLLNAPGNFTASKLAWVKQYEPAVYEKIDKVLLPGDFIAMKLTGEITTTASALSEGILWDFISNDISEHVLNHFGFSRHIFPAILPLFSSHGTIKNTIAAKLSINPAATVCYKSGDQPNNALSLNVLQPGEVAATAGTSGVIYGVSDQLQSDVQSRINSFAHVNHSEGQNRIGILLCINGTGIFNRWIKKLAGNYLSYKELNKAAAGIAEGSDGLLALPFGNGAERMLNNKQPGAHFKNLDFNIHGQPHMVRAAQESVAFAFRYGLDIMRSNGMQPGIIRAAKTNLFLSDVFTQTFVNCSGVAIEFYEGDGSLGAAIGAGIGKAVYTETSAFTNRKATGIAEPVKNNAETLYQAWLSFLQQQLDLSI